jgi:hypothetical protein
VGPDAQRTLALAGAADLGLGNVRRLAILPMRVNPDPAAAPDIPAGRDLDDVLGGAAENGDIFVLLRPDRYVAAATRIANENDLALFAASVRALCAGTRAHAPDRRGTAPLGQTAT